MATRLPPGQGALQNWNNINLNKPEQYSSEFIVGGNKFANVTDVSTGQRQLYFVQPVFNQRGLLTTTNADGTVTKGGNYDNFNQGNPGKLAAAEAASKQASVVLLSTPNISTPTESAAIKNSSQFKSTAAGNNAAPSNPNSPTKTDTKPAPAPPGAAPPGAAEEAASLKDNTRTSYSDTMKYPINLQSEVQDVIKFSILEYSPSLAKGNEGKGRIVTLEGGNPIVKGSKRIGTITLPIPAGISDSNTVGWEKDDLNDLQKAAAEAGNLFLGGASPEQSAKPMGTLAEQAASKEGQDAVRGFFLGLALNNQRLMTRTQGAILNNNAELLFSGPSLRSFSFTFLFYPREPNEAKMVKQIIRAFKQAMSVKRSKTSLLLKSPHTFAIQYMTAGQKAHPYLNRFKECALTSCNVDYTPDGTYMTYNDPEKSMTAYRLGLTFQELEPIFDDEYGSDDDNIGF